MSIRAPLRSRHKTTLWPWILPSHVQRHAVISSIPLSHFVSNNQQAETPRVLQRQEQTSSKLQIKTFVLVCCYKAKSCNSFLVPIKSIVLGKITNSHKTRYNGYSNFVAFSSERICWFWSSCLYTRLWIC